jgi:uncharacterized protein (TIGR03435 family)
MVRSHVLPWILLISGFAAAQSFEVASVKPVESAELRTRYKPLEGGSGSKTPTRIGGHVTFQGMVMRAYGVTSRRISGPSWMDEGYYEIAATLAPGATKEQERMMWQNLLKERFHLEAHRETRELPVFLLVTGKNGPKFKTSDPAAEAADMEAAAASSSQPRPKVTMGEDGFPQIPADAKIHGSFTLSLSSGEFLRIKMFYRHKTMAELADAISSYAGRLVDDRTGLKGKYDFTLAFETDPSEPASRPGGELSTPAERGAGLFTAVQEQLGLKLDAAKSKIEMLVIDRVERAPTEN